MSPVALVTRNPSQIKIRSDQLTYRILLGLLDGKHYVQHPARRLTEYRQTLPRGRGYVSLALHSDESWEQVLASLDLLGDELVDTFLVLLAVALDTNGTERIATPFEIVAEENETHLYEVGPLLDVAVYPLTILTTILDPARSLTAFGKVIYPDRITTGGTPFHVTTPDFSIAAIEFANGAVARLTTNFYVGFHSKQRGIEFHGDKGSLFLSNWHDFNGIVEYADFAALPPAGDPYKLLPYVKEPYSGIAGDPRTNVEWSRGVVDMAEAMQTNRPQRITAAQVAHVVDIVCGIQTASREGRRVQILSGFPQPTPMGWAK